MSGGAERQLVNLVRSTSDDVVTHVVCVIDDPSFFQADVLSAGYPVISFGINKKRPFFEAASRFRRVIADERPDVIHSWLYDANIAARMAVFPSRRMPIITSLQLADYEPEAARIGNWNPYKIFGLRMIDRVTSWFARPHFVACSEFVLRSYEKHFGFGGSDASVIFNSVDPAALSTPGKRPEELRSQLGLPTDAFVYLNVGRLDPQKNHRSLFEAFAHVLTEVRDAYLLLAGAGQMDAGLKTLATELGIGSRVLFLGRRDDIGTLLELADVFVFPSLFEGLPVALVEAMFFSLPCIASEIPVFREVIEDGVNGLLVDPHSPSELGHAMIKLSNDPGLRTSLGERAFELVNKRFHTVQTAPRWEDLYRQMSTKPGNTRGNL